MEDNCKGIDESNWNTTQPKFILAYFLTKLLRTFYKFSIRTFFFIYINMKKNTNILVAVMIIKSATNQFIIVLSLQVTCFSQVPAFVHRYVSSVLRKHKHYYHQFLLCFFLKQNFEIHDPWTMFLQVTLIYYCRLFIIYNQVFYDLLVIIFSYVQVFIQQGISLEVFP